MNTQTGYCWIVRQGNCPPVISWEGINVKKIYVMLAAGLGLMGFVVRRRQRGEV